jgi:hypothetical protein
MYFSALVGIVTIKRDGPAYGANDLAAKDGVFFIVLFFFYIVLLFLFFCFFVFCFVFLFFFCVG